MSGSARSWLQFTWNGGPTVKGTIHLDHAGTFRPVANEPTISRSTLRQRRGDHETVQRNNFNNVVGTGSFVRFRASERLCRISRRDGEVAHAAKTHATMWLT